MQALARTPVVARVAAPKAARAAARAALPVPLKNVRACVRACVRAARGGQRPPARACAPGRAIQRHAGRVGARRTPGFRAGRAGRAAAAGRGQSR